MSLDARVWLVGLYWRPDPAQVAALRGAEAEYQQSVLAAARPEMRAPSAPRTQ